MVHRGTTRESKKVKPLRISTLEDKWRRHKNKARIWQRCVRKLALAQQEV
jgi:hypothetical protein